MNAKPKPRLRAASSTPKLPHERDESSRQPRAPRTRVMKSAHDDVKAGRVDTDPRGVSAGRAFQRAFAADPTVTADGAGGIGKKRRR